MADAEFSVGLKDEITRNALKAQASIKSLEAQLQSLNRAAATARGGDAFKRFNIGNQLKAARDQANVAKSAGVAQAKAVAKAQAYQARVTAAANAKQITDQARTAKALASHRQFKADNGLGGSLSSAMPISGATAVAAGLAVLTAGAIAAVAAVVKLGVAFSEAAIEGARFGQRSVQALTLLIGDAGTAIVQFNDLRREAASLGLDVEGTEKSFQKLLAAQFDISKAREFIRMGSDLQAIGATADDVSGALLAITQIKSKGKLQAEEMLQLQERGISAELVYNELTKTLGKTRDELAKMQKAGEIRAPEALEAILGAVRHKTGVQKTGDAGKAFAANTLDGMKGKFEGGIKNLFIDIGATIEQHIVPIAQKVVELFDEIINDPNVQAFGHYLLNEFIYFQGWLDANWPEIKETIKGGLYAVMDAIRLTVDAIDVSMGYWEQFKYVIYGVGGAFAIMSLMGFMVVGMVFLLIGIVVGLLAILAYAVVWLVENFTKIPLIIYEALRGAATWAYQGGSNIVQGLIDGIMAKWETLKTTVQQLASAVTDPFAAAMGMHSPSKVFEQYGIYTVQGYVQGIEANDNKITGASADMAGRAMSGMGNVGDDAETQGTAASRGRGDITVHIDQIVASTEEGGRAAARGLYSELVELLEGAEAA